MQARGPLMIEHRLIGRMISLIKDATVQIESTHRVDPVFVDIAVDFIRMYADRTHHGKEEDILFEFFDKDLDIIKVMFEDHTIGRNYVKNTVQGIKDRDLSVITENLSGYAGLLKQHIKKEDEVLYPWIDRSLTTHQVGELYSRCLKVEEEFGETPKEYEDLAILVAKEFS